MKTAFSLLFLLWLFVKSQAQTWINAADFPGIERDDAIGFSIQDEGYVGTGVTPGPIYHNDFYSYRPESNKWEQLPSIIGQGRQYCSSLSFEDRGCIVGGVLRDGSYSRDLQCFIPSENRWWQMAPLPQVAPRRAAAASFALFDIGFVAGGRAFPEVFDDFWAYHLSTGKWQELSPLPFGSRHEMVSFTQNGLAFVGLGLDENGNCKNDFWSYNPIVDEWKQLNNFPGNICSYAIAFSAAGTGYVCTGLEADDKVTDEFWKYDQVEDAWTRLQNPEFGQLRGVAHFNVSRCSYVITGIDQNFSRNNRTWRNCDLAETTSGYVVYPNPAFEKLTIARNDEGDEIEIRLISSGGEHVFNTEMKRFTREIYLNLSTLNSGLYFLRLIETNGKVLETFKILHNN